MKLLNVPRFRLAILQALCENTLIICKDIAEVTIEYGIVDVTLQDFKKGMTKDQASAEDKFRLDKNRDKFISGFMSGVNAEEKFPNEDAGILKALGALLKIIQKYDFKITRLSYYEETVAIDNMLTDIGKIDISPLDPIGIPRWIPVITQANKEFIDATTKFVSDSHEAATRKAASKLVPTLEDALEELYTQMFSVIRTSPTDQLRKAYGKLEFLIDSMD